MTNVAVRNNTNINITNNSLHASIKTTAADWASVLFTFKGKRKEILMNFVILFFYMIISTMLFDHYNTKLMTQSNKNTVDKFQGFVDTNARYLKSVSSIALKYNVEKYVPVVVQTLSIWMAAAHSVCKSGGKPLSNIMHVLIIFMAALYTCQQSIYDPHDSFIDAIERITTNGTLDGGKTSLLATSFFPKLLPRIRLANSSFVGKGFKMLGVLVFEPKSPLNYLESFDTKAATMIRRDVYKPVLNILLSLIQSGYIAVTPRGGFALYKLFFERSNPNGIILNTKLDKIQRKRVKDMDAKICDLIKERFGKNYQMNNVMKVLNKQIAIEFKNL
jgi:hypothetical protein